MIVLTWQLETKHNWIFFTGTKKLIQVTCSLLPESTLRLVSGMLLSGPPSQRLRATDLQLNLGGSMGKGGGGGGGRRGRPIWSTVFNLPQCFLWSQDSSEKVYTPLSNTDFIVCSVFNIFELWGMLIVLLNLLQCRTWVFMVLSKGTAPLSLHF